MSTKVTMLLTDKDVENAERLHRLTNSRTRAQAVSIALSLSSFIAEQRRNGAQLQLRHPDGTVQAWIMNGTTVTGLAVLTGAGPYVVVPPTQ